MSGPVRAKEQPRLEAMGMPQLIDQPLPSHFSKSLGESYKAYLLSNCEGLGFKGPAHSSLLCNIISVWPTLDL